LLSRIEGGAVSDTPIDTKTLDADTILARALAVLTPFVGTSSEAKYLHQVISASHRVTASQRRKVFGERGFEAQFLERFGEPVVAPVQRREIPGVTRGYLTSYKPRRATFSPQPIQSPVLETFEALRPYEEETTPARRAMAWARENGITLIQTREISPVFPFSWFNPVQSEAFRYITEDVNLVVCAPTSVGKSEIAAVYAAYAIAAGKKAVYLSPLKTLSAEKYDLWSSPEYLFGGNTVTLHTGDWVLTPSKREALNRSDLLLFTSEILDSQSRHLASHPEGESYLPEMGVLLCDEAHLLGSEGRGSKLEAALIRISRQAPSARVLLLSATIANAEEIQDWITQLTGRRTVLIQSDFRPTKLDVHLLSYPSSFRYASDLASKINSALDIVQEYPDDQFLIFCHSKGDMRALVSEGKKRGISIGMHNADLSREKRNAAETAFRTGRTRVLSATPTVAMGVNLPARRVIILGVTRGLTEVSSTELLQEIGRSGRTGIDPKGDAYVLIPSDRMDRAESFLMPLPVRSELWKDEVLAFHLLAEVHSGKNTPQDLLDWYTLSFRAYQAKDAMELEATLTRVLEDLIRIDCLLKDRNGCYFLTELGSIAATFYYSPYDCWDWLQNLRTVWDRECWDNDWSIAWAVGDIHSYRADFIPKALSTMSYTISKHPIRNGSLPAIVAIYEAIQGRSKNLGDLGVLPWWLQISSDAKRVCTVLALLQRTFFQTTFLPEDELSIRLQKGVRREYVALARLPGVGPVYAERLYEAGIQTPGQLVAYSGDLSVLLGRKADKILEGAQRFLRGDRDEDP
jgi:helicase